MRIFEFGKEQKIYSKDFFDYFNELQRHLGINKTSVVWAGCELTIVGTTLQVSEGLVKGKDVNLSFLKQGAGATVATIAKVEAATVNLNDGDSKYIVAKLYISSTNIGQKFYDITADVQAVDALSTTFPVGNIIGEVTLGKATRNGSTITIDTSERAANFATQQQVDEAETNDKGVTPLTLYGSYGYNDPVEVNANHLSTIEEHIVIARTQGIVITLPSSALYPKARRNSLAKRVLNLSTGNITVKTASGATVVLATINLAGGGFSAAQIPTINNGILI